MKIPPVQDPSDIRYFPRFFALAADTGTALCSHQVAIESPPFTISHDSVHTQPHKQQPVHGRPHDPVYCENCRTYPRRMSGSSRRSTVRRRADRERVSPRAGNYRSLACLPVALSAKRTERASDGKRQRGTWRREMRKETTRNRDRERTCASRAERAELLVVL